MAAPRQRMAPPQPPQRHPPSPHPPVPHHRHIRILAARRKILALRYRQHVQQGRHAPLVEPQQRTSNLFASRTRRSVSHNSVETADAVDGKGAFAAPRSYAACTLRKIVATSRFSCTKSKSITLRRGCKITSTGALSSGSAARTASRNHTKEHTSSKIRAEEALPEPGTRTKDNTRAQHGSTGIRPSAPNSGDFPA